MTSDLITVPVTINFDWQHVVGKLTVNPEAARLACTDEVIFSVSVRRSEDGDQLMELSIIPEDRGERLRMTRTGDPS